MIKFLQQSFTDKRQHKYLNISIVIAVIAMFAVSYLNRSLGVLSFNGSLITVIIALIPSVLVLTGIYILADAPARKQYRIRLYLGIIVFTIIGYLRYGR
ncbi:hypothetical protein QCD85_16985 [Paenibacillus sp. PsM32]|uniref:hypothetical protein n=1 Tax=unclassified Paenibacillus TaxID=185978 RepID=UPI00263B0E6C|nr:MULTISPECIES: hypothetical protein [unclassified Paenibacillus]MDN4619807.1 hypothetical protein [Paenibacillus sp. PsM32]MDQ1235444.1 hypothetical protein [Paenibacillus sp. SORGH_AS_0306]MDR6112493.1 hypothetical protein [Paenibacillus sp. SORGH_AS_0338]